MSAVSSVSVKAGTLAVTDRLSRMQVGILVLCGLVGFLDGNDTAAMGIGASSIATALQLRPGAMGWAISGSFYGAAMGALAFGLLGDRIGRKKVLVAAVVLFGVFTVLTPWSQSLPQLVVIRSSPAWGLGAPRHASSRWHPNIRLCVFVAPWSALSGRLFRWESWWADC